MFEAVSIAAGGLYTQQKRLDTIANNVSNVNTVGYKGSRMEFDEAMYTATTGGLKGHGVAVGSTNKSFSQGTILATNNPYDLAIEGEGFFEVMDGAGNLQYTRAGNFYVSVEADGNYLVTSEGYYVMDADGQRIAIPDEATSIIVSETGEITFEGVEDADPVQLGIYTFSNKYGLTAVGENCYRVSEASGGKQAVEEPTIRQGALENSNVDLASEMVNMIRAQRTFSLVSRALTTADDMEGVANNMKG